MAAQYAVGIDLGTTNSVISYIPLDAEIPKAQLVLVPQQVAASTLEEMTGLPSFLYLAPEIEASANAETLPWNHESARFAGEWARRRSAEVPDRTVGAAKSWLCYSEVDRTESILPWNAPEEVGKVSPVTASAEYLLHLVHAWNVSFPEAPLDRQQVTLTVPASFDASARDLTREAAVNAGLPADLILLEEPQAALYAWLEEQEAPVPVPEHTRGNPTPDPQKRVRGHQLEIASNRFPEWVTHHRVSNRRKFRDKPPAHDQNAEPNQLPEYLCAYRYMETPDSSGSTTAAPIDTDASVVIAHRVHWVRLDLTPLPNPPPTNASHRWPVARPMV